MTFIASAERTILRTFTSNDLDALADIQADPEVMRFVSGRSLTRDETAAQIERIIAYQRALGFSLWAVVERDTGALLGRAGLLVQIIDGVPEVELAYLLAREAWGRGIGTEVAGAILRHAREVVGLRRVIALVHPDNQASARVVQKVGFTRERRIAWHDEPREVFSMTNSKT